MNNSYLYHPLNSIGTPSHLIKFGTGLCCQGFNLINHTESTGTGTLQLPGDHVSNDPET